ALADLLVSSLNNNGGAFHQSPAMTACEAEVVRAFARLYELPDGAEGMFLPGGTYATLQALALARFRAVGPHAPGPGLRVGDRRTTQGVRVGGKRERDQCELLDGHLRGHGRRRQLRELDRAFSDDVAAQDRVELAVDDQLAEP